MLQLPLQSITMGQKQEYSRLVMEMESTDQSVREANIKICTGRKWKAHAEVDQAICRLQQKRDNQQSPSRKGRPWAWSSPKILVQGQQEREKGAGRYRGENERQTIKAVASIGHSAPADCYIQFVQEEVGGTSAYPRVPWRLTLLTQDCSMRVYLDRKLQFPTDITSTSLHPDIVMWSSSSKTVLFVELTIPWKAGMEAAWERKRFKYDDLASECREAGWKTTIYPVEVGCCVFVGTSTFYLMRDLGVSGARFRKALKYLAEEAKKSNFWLWIKRKDTCWGTT